MKARRHGFTVIEYSIITFGLLFAACAIYAGMR